MANETWGLWEWLDVGGQPRSDVNKVTEEAVRRIQDQSKKAQQVHQQIQQDKTNNTAIAQFLTFLLKTVQNDKIVSLLYDVFFKTKNPETGVTHLRKKIKHLFRPLIKESWSMSFGVYIAYIKQLAAKYHDNIALDQELLLKLLSEIIKYFEVHGKKITDEEHAATIAQIKKELF